jgi:hypothetical protein
MKRLRRRRASGLVVLLVEVDEVNHVEMLVEAGLLARERAEDRGAIARATARLLAGLRVADLVAVTRHATASENLPS